MIAQCDTLLMGRKSYETFAASFSGQSGGMADAMNHTPKFVVSTTLKQADWQNSTLINEVVADPKRTGDRFEPVGLVDQTGTPANHAFDTDTAVWPQADGSFKTGISSRRRSPTSGIASAAVRMVATCSLSACRR
jgi:hypothetical protein